MDAATKYQREGVLLALALRMSVHDEPMPGLWVCGHCPYVSVGSACRKCWAPRYEGQPIWDGRYVYNTIKVA